VTTAIGAGSQNPPPPPGNPAVNLRTTASAKPAKARPGRKVTLTFRVTNNGDKAATKAKLAGKLPSGLKRVKVRSTAGKCAKGAKLSCALGTLAPGKSAAVTATVKVKRKGKLRVRATATSAQTDAKPSNNTAAVTVKRR
jgi:uncharacterized repeat protein (TIGR01451 family)